MKRRTRIVTQLALVAATAAALPVAHYTARSLNTETPDARQQLETLVVAPRQPAGYDRDLFDHWITDDRTECSTRQQVLADEIVSGTFNPATCQVHDGAWIDRYSQGAPTLTDPADIEIDHLVPLAHAWATGARDWTPQRREAFANDLDNPSSLTAVSAEQNRTKSADAPDQWQPPNTDARCTYATDWISVKHDWDLTVTHPELDALTEMLDTCPVPNPDGPENHD